MSDAERMRQAAEVMDSATFYEPPDDGDLDTPAAEWVIHCHACAVNERTADLLRAVADDVAIGLYIVGAESPAAALALAATILGSE